MIVRSWGFKSPLAHRYRRGQAPCEEARAAGFGMTLNSLRNIGYALTKLHKNFFANNGYEPIDDIKALMALNLTKKGPDLIAIGDGNGSCINLTTGPKQEKRITTFMCTLFDISSMK